MNCRHCESKLEIDFLDLGTAPYSNAFLKKENLNIPEVWNPLRVSVCDTCWLVQTKEILDSATLFTDDYVYFSGYSSTWVNHAKEYATMLIDKYGANQDKFFIEIASNDGTFISEVRNKGLRVLGIEPTESTAESARALGIETLGLFLDRNAAREIKERYGSADFIAANNVLAHVPNLNDFVSGIAELLDIDGVATIEFPHIMNLIQKLQFDTIYHEHFSYFSLLSVENVLETNGLGVVDVQEISVHGGSLRVFVKRKENIVEISPEVDKMRLIELEYGLGTQFTYTKFAVNVEKLKLESLDFLVTSKLQGRKLVGYGAAAKGNTFLNYLGIKSDMISYIVDANPSKQGKFTPGSRIPVVSEAVLRADKPDFVIIFPWNLTEEIASQLSYIREWGAKFVVFIPELSVF
jgi:SAM-dependent methyltransferase